MADNKYLTKEDIELFRDSVKGTRPLDHDDKASTSPEPRKFLKKRTPQFGESPPHQPEPFISIPERELVSPEQTLFFARPGLQHQLLRKLRNDKLRIEATLDLHGLTVHQAQTELQNFIQRSQQNHSRWVRIIHGKGQRSQTNIPVLKNYVNQWLRAQSVVLAFCSASAKHGGVGALTVLLKL